MHEPSCCCKQPNCPQWIELNTSFLKAKNDTFFEEDLGQTFLKDQTPEEYEKNMKELDQLRRQKEESDKVIEILQEELRSMQSYCNELKGVLQVNEKVQRLLNAKANVEQELTTQTNDLKQELKSLDKANTTLHARYKRLHEKHETLKVTHEVLVREHEQKLLTRNESREERVIRTQWDASTLFTVTQQAWDKLNATDVRVLNKRLDRRLDMTDLSELSNTMLSRLVEDDLSRFCFQHDCQNQPLAQLVCLMLKEMCTIKITLNDLQADFVRRIKASSRPPQPILYQKQSWIQSLFTFCPLA